MSLPTLFVAFLSISIHNVIAEPTSYTKIHFHYDNLNKSHCLMLEQGVYPKDFADTGVVLEMQYFFGIHHLDMEFGGDLVNTSQIVEIYSPTGSENRVQEEIDEMCHFQHYPKPEPPQQLTSVAPASAVPDSKVRMKSGTSTKEVRKIIYSGDPSNRIDVVFMGDGYTQKERTKFFADINRLVKETLEEPTFSEFLPLMNIWAIFVPSIQSGISYTGQPKNTAFKVYRASGMLRGIFLKNVEYARTVCKLTGEYGCDFPVIIANDNYYGGVGGEFAVSTSSLTSGALVLRHELGHNFARVGEEYDNGEVYTGVNASPNLQNLKWKAWLSPSSETDDTCNENESVTNITAREERMIYRILVFPRNDLDKKPLSLSFNSDGTYSRWFMQVTLAGAPEEDSVRFALDGQALHWETKGTDDKTIYSWTNTTKGLSKGRHTLKVSATEKALKNSALKKVKVPRMVGSVFFYEYGNEDEFHISNDFISAYPTWNANGRKSYRPTNNGCLMRNMTHNEFCSVCKEGMYLQFMRKISLIDEFTINDKLEEDGSQTVDLKVINFGQFRTVGRVIEGERVEIRWIKDGQEVPEMNDELSIRANKGQWLLTVRLVTPRVRNDPRTVLLDKRKFAIS